jgi:arabinan endo-1,5-alpha-L-arabinosidase
MLQRRGGKRWLGGVAGSLLVLSLGGMTAVPASGAAVAPGTVPASRTAVAAGAAAIGYPNPGTATGDVRVHDPSMIRAADGTYYLFSTHNGIEIRSSADRVAFTLAGSVLRNGATWASAYGNIHDLWAPDVSYHNGTYWLYFSVSSFGSNHSAIGLATSSTAAPGSWHDQGLVYASQSAGNFNAIDPSLSVDSGGRWWLSLGSFWSGIKMIQIDPATGKQAGWNTTRYSIAQRPSPDAEEASYVYPHGGYYYLFVSFDYCCRGVNSTYRIMVGRSARPTGPYVDESGTPMAAGGGTQILASHGYVIGPGGQSVMHDAGGDLLLYHYYAANANGTPELGINLLGWDSAGWPYVM